MGSGGVAIAALPTVICLKVPFSDGLGGEHYIAKRLPTKNELVFAVVGNRLIVVGNSNHFKK